MLRRPRTAGTTIGITEPLHLTPVLVSKPWGGRRLERFGRRLPPDVPIGESWEVADLAAADAAGVAEPSTPVAAGPFAGSSLADLIALDREALLGSAAERDGRFPVLIKLLDVHAPLSVQVHPPEAYVARWPAARLKTETWVVLEAEPDARFMIGLADGVTPDQLRKAVGTPELPALLHHVPARVGDVVHLPAGTIHAATGGVLLAEVQTPSDTTFRLFDWTEELDRPRRDLHLDAGLEALELAWEEGSPTRRAEPATLPLDVGHYRVERCHLDVEEARGIAAGSLRIVQVTEGELTGDGFAWPVSAGGTVVLPAAWSGRLRSRQGASWLETTVPDD